MRWETLALAGLLVLAGCIGASASVQDAKSLEETAREAAEEHIEDPRLVAAFAAEPPAHVEDLYEDAEVFIHLDDDPGDGQAPGWAYHFVGQERQAFLLVNDVIGVVAEAYGPLDDERTDRTFIEGWEIGSQQAAESLRDDQRWPAANQSHLVLWELEMTDGHPVWTVELSQGTDLFDSEAEAQVSARNGTVLTVREAGEQEQAFPEPGTRSSGACEAGSTSGTLSPVTPMVFHVSLDEVGFVQATANAGGAGTLDFVIEDEEGQPVAQSGGPTLDGFQDTLEVVPAEAGDYTIRLSTQAGAFQAQLAFQAGWGSGCSGQHQADTGQPGMGPFDAWARAQFQAWLVG